MRKWYFEWTLCANRCTTASLYCLAPSLALGWGGYNKIWMETEMCEYPSPFSLSHLFPPLFAHCTQFFPFNLACVGNVRPFFWFVFASSSFVSVCRKFSLISSSHLGASSFGRILKFCIKKNSVEVSLLLVCFYWFLGVFCFFGGVCWRCRRCRSGFGFWGLVDADGCFGSDALLLYYCVLFFPDSFILLLI